MWFMNSYDASLDVHIGSSHLIQGRSNDPYREASVQSAHNDHTVHHRTRPLTTISHPQGVLYAHRQETRRHTHY